MSQIKKILKKHFGTFVYFYGFLRSRIFISVALSISTCILDAFGLSMFLPLLQMADGGSPANVDAMGNLRFLLDGIVALGLEVNLEFILLFMLSFFIFKAIAYYLGMVYDVKLKQYFIKSIRVNLLDSLNALDFKKFVTSNAGRIQNTMSGEVERVAQAYSSYFDALQQVLMVFVYMSLAFFVDVQFAILVSVGGVITNLLYRTIYKQTKIASGKLTFSSNIYQGEIIQHVGNFKYLKATGMLTKHSDKLKDTINRIESSRKKIGIWGSIGSAAREPLLITVVTVVILIQIKLLGGELATIFISLLFFYRGLNSLAYMQQHWNNFVSVSGSLENMQNFQEEIKTQPEINGDAEFSSLKSSIRLDNVSFSYGNAPILFNVSTDIITNQTTAFVGESGSGKTTMVNLIAGLLTADSGTMYVDNVSLDKIKKQSYQRRIGYITQEPVIFNDTIFNNVTFWSEPSEDNLQRFNKAVTQASLANFVEALPEGRNTELGNNGINLSGGQRQRISIARELFKEIDILIMDEATSALDSETESLIQQSIEALKGYYTLIIVAHRLSTIRNADHLIIMDGGKIADQGTFSSLVDKYPKFKKMVTLQEI